MRVRGRFANGMPRVAPPPDQLDKANYELLAEFRYTLRKFLGFSEAAATGHGVTAQQYQALLAIEGYPGRNWVTVGELAEQLRIAHHSAVGLVNRMEALKLVARTRAETDRRQVRVSLTPKGLGILSKLYRVHRAELRTVGPKLVSLLQIASVDPATAPPEKTFSSPACSMPELE